LPSLDGRSGLAKGLFGNWEFGTIVIAETGTPLTVFTGPIPGLNGGPSGTGYTDNQRPNRVEGQPCRATSGPKEQWLNPGAFTLTGFQLGSIGNSGRGICTGPGFFQVDVSLYKMIKLSERTKIQLRFEVFNLLNRTNFLSLPGGSTTMNPSDATFNGPVGEATQITGFTLPGTFGQASSARDPRQAQFGIKLIF
jgi:hypothetical protein